MPSSKVYRHCPIACNDIMDYALSSGIHDAISPNEVQLKYSFGAFSLKNGREIDREKHAIRAVDKLELIGNNNPLVLLIIEYLHSHISLVCQGTMATITKHIPQESSQSSLLQIRLFRPTAEWKSPSSPLLRRTHDFYATCDD